MNTKCGRDGDGIYPNISNFLPRTSTLLAMFINISQEPLGDNKRTKLLTQKVKGKPDRVARDFLAFTTKDIITILTWLVVSCYTALLAKSWKLIKASAPSLPLHWWADQPAGQLVSYWDWHELRHHCRPLAGEMEIITNWRSTALTTTLNLHFSVIIQTIGLFILRFLNVLLLRNLCFYKIQGKLKRRMMVIKK